MAAIYDRYFRWIHGNHLVYNTCWEDPRLDREALQLCADSTVLVITSAGCNALDYALAGARAVYAVDVNPRQNALLEIKVAGIRALSFEEFFLLFGKGIHPDFASTYRSRLRHLLSESARSFWDAHLDLFSRSGHIRGFYDHGTSGLVARSVGWYVRNLARVEEQVRELFNCSCREKQRALYFDEIKPRLWNSWIQYIAKSPLCMSLLGVPRAQRELLKGSHQNGICGFIESAFDAVFAELSLHDNYFWRVYLLGSYDEQCCPEYLTESGFTKLKEGLWESITVTTCSVSEFLERATASISHAVLLDHMDWLYAHTRDEIRREWQGLIDRSSGTTRVIWRSAGSHVPGLEDTPVTVAGRRRELGTALSMNTDYARELHQRDRVHTYCSFHIADLNLQSAA